VNYGIYVIILRYFTVYGPRQRPDMAIHIMFRDAIEKGEITIFGDGSQARDFTYVSDAVKATIQTMDYSGEFEVFNVASGRKVSLLEVVKSIQNIIGKDLKIKFEEWYRGDVRETFGDISKAMRLLNYKPEISLEEGLNRQFLWHKKIHSYLRT
jgi:nucleoside-diphosphate-sugar epimerase